MNWLQWHPRGNVLLAGSEDFTAWLWHAQTGACMHVRRDHIVLQSDTSLARMLAPRARLAASAARKY